MGIFQNATFTVKRGGSAVTSIPAFPAQVDNLSQQEASYYGGAAPYFRYSIIPIGVVPPVEQMDLLVDTKNIDPVTQTNKQYRVVNDPSTEQFLSHCEIVADRYRGT